MNFGWAAWEAGEHRGASNQHWAVAVAFLF